MNFFRQDLLRILESCIAGLNPKESLEQSSCFVFDDGSVTTYNGEILCRATVVNDEGSKFICHGAVPAKPLLDTLRKSPDEVLTVVAHDDHISIKGTGRKQKIVLSSDIMLSTHEVEEPSEFVDLPPVFSEALSLVATFAGKDLENYELNCVAIGPRGLQATNRFMAIRYVVASGRKEGAVLLRAASLKPLTGLGLAKASYGQEFVWFETYSGTKVAVRMIIADYPNLSGIFAEETKALVELPCSAADMIGRSVPFVAENANGKIIEISMGNKNLIVEAKNAVGEFYEEKEINYDGPKVTFRVNPESFNHLFRSGAAIEVTSTSLRTRGDGYCLVISAEEI